jgi:uncharacterized oligopeptide transporter (OPT) family protein
MGVLRLFRKSNILENNIVQTAASAGESLAAGVIFTLPALVILNYWNHFSYVWVMLIAGFGGILGVLFTIPLRRTLILEAKLKFPEGMATAEVLKTGERGSGVKDIAWAAMAGGLFKFVQAGLQIWKGTFEVARGIGGTVAYFGANRLIAIPICAAFDLYPLDCAVSVPAAERAHQIWAEYTRYIGVGGMVVGGLWTILKMRTSIFSGIKSGLAAYRGARAGTVEVARTERDISMKWILILVASSAVPLFLLYQTFVGRVTVSLPMAVTMLVMGFVFSAVAGYMGGLVGSSNNPISGVTIATVLFCSLLLLLLMGAGAKNGPAAAIIIGSVVCCAASIAGDNLQDLKAGYLVGATPWRQQVMQIVGTVSAALVMAPILTLLLKAYGFAGHSSATSKALAAPQAHLMASVAQGVFEGGLPWNFIFIGMLVAVVVILLDSYLERRGSSFRAPVLAVAIGFYLPLKLEVPIIVGAVIHEIVRRRRAAMDVSKGKVEESGQRGLLFASGLITGEALIGIALAIPIVISSRQDVLAVLDEPMGPWPGLLLMAGLGYWLYRTALGKIKN